MDSASCSLRMCCGEVRTCLSGSDSQTGVSLFRPIGTGIDVAHWGRKGGLGSQSCWEIADCGSKQVWPNTRCLELSYYIDAYSLCGCMPSHFSCVWLFVTIWTVAHQGPLSMGFFRQEYWNGLPCLPPGDLPDQGTERMSLSLLHLQAGSLLLVPPGKPNKWTKVMDQQCIKKNYKWIVNIQKMQKLKSKM